MNNMFSFEVTKVLPFRTFSVLRSATCGFYASGSNDRGYIVFGLSVIVCVCHCVCVSQKFNQNFNIGHNFCNMEDSNLIFGMHVYLIELHILSGERSRSSFKVKEHYFIF